MQFYGINIQYLIQYLQHGYSKWYLLFIFFLVFPVYRGDFLLLLFHLGCSYNARVCLCADSYFFQWVRREFLFTGWGGDTFWIISHLTFFENWGEVRTPRPLIPPWYFSDMILLFKIYTEVSTFICISVVSALGCHFYCILINISISF